MSKKYYLFRHGETYFSKTDTPYGEHELTAEILPEKKYAIENIAHYLKDKQIDYAARSEFLRCKQTADIIEEKTDIRFIVDPLLHEMVEKDFTFFEKRMRVLAEKLEALPQEKIALCTHGGVISGLKKLLLGEEFHAHDLMYYPKTGQILVIENGERTEIDFNL